jgi:molybdate transport system permease protein
VAADPADLAATLAGGTTTIVLLWLGTPIAWWLARTRHWAKGAIGAFVTLPLVLPPTVLGFYLLVLIGPDGMRRPACWQASGLQPCPSPSVALSSPR